MELPQKRCTTPRAPLTRPRAALTLRVSITCAPTFSSTAARLCAGRGAVSASSGLPSSPWRALNKSRQKNELR